MIRRMKRWTPIWPFVVSLFATAADGDALAAPVQGAAPVRKACDFLTKSDALEASLLIRASEGSACGKSTH
jgi:hypothetical protein